MILLNHSSHYSYYQWEFILFINLYLKQQNQQVKDGRFSALLLVPQGAIAGFLDAIGGGGWGPVNTPLLLSRNKIEPRYVIGTVSASEFFVTISTSLGFIIFLGWSQINILLVVALAFWWRRSSTVLSMVSEDFTSVCSSSTCRWSNHIYK